MSRESAISAVADRLCSRSLGHPLRVGVDGVCGVGKSTFAAELVDHIGKTGRAVLRIDSDGFHNTRQVRYRQGRDSARGYYEDAYDFASLRDHVLAPLGVDGSLRYATRVHDLQTDAVVREWAVAPADAIIVFDATFLQRDELREHWDEVVFLDASMETAQARAIARDAAGLGGTAQATEVYRNRYMAACTIYLTEQQPRARATLVVDHNDPMNPRLLDE